MWPVAKSLTYLTKLGATPEEITQIVHQCIQESQPIDAVLQDTVMARVETLLESKTAEISTGEQKEQKEEETVVDSGAPVTDVKDVKDVDTESVRYVAGSLGALGDRINYFIQQNPENGHAALHFGSGGATVFDIVPYVMVCGKTSLYKFVPVDGRRTTQDSQAANFFHMVETETQSTSNVIRHYADQTWGQAIDVSLESRLKELKGCTLDQGLAKLERNWCMPKDANFYWLPNDNTNDDNDQAQVSGKWHTEETFADWLEERKANHLNALHLLTTLFEDNPRSVVVHVCKYTRQHLETHLIKSCESIMSF